MKLFLFLFLFCTSAMASNNLKLFKFENYLSWTGKFNQKQAEEDFARLFPVGTDMGVILDALKEDKLDECGKMKDVEWDWVNKSKKSEREREREYFCSKYLRSLGGLFTKSDRTQVYMRVDDQNKLLEFKINHYNNAFVI